MSETRAASSGLSTYREGSLHAALKAMYAAATPGSATEQAVDGYVIDVVTAAGLVEIQTGSFGSAAKKLARLVDTHRITLVYPVAVEKWLLRVDADGVILGRRRSPKHGIAADVFEELVHIPALLAHPNFEMDIVLIREEELRGPAEAGVRYRYPREWRRLDRRLVEVVETLRVEHPANLLALLPATLPDPFTTKDIAAATGRSQRLAGRAAYCLERSGAVARLSRAGRMITYGRSDGMTQSRTMPG